MRKGQVFNGSYERGQSLRVLFKKTLPCWREAVVLMEAGGRSNITCPPGPAYGDQAAVRHQKSVLLGICGKMPTGFTLLLMFASIIPTVSG